MEGDVELREPEGGEPEIEPSVDEVPAESAEPDGRRYPSTLGGLCYLLALAVSVAGLVIVTQGDWRLGVKWVAVSLAGAALARLLLPVPQAGMLAVRRRWVDVLLLSAAGAALWFLSVTIPNQPPL
jgi:Protein of unknown function (DUF3017)